MRLADRQRARVAVHGEVKNTSELRRVKALPTRPPLDVTPQQLTDTLGGRGVTLNLGQTLVLTDLFEWNGVLGALPVGEGKTWCCHQAPQLLGYPERPILLEPGTHRTKTVREFDEISQLFPEQRAITWKRCKQLAKNKRGSDDPFDHWRPHDVLVISYEEVSNDPELLLSLPCDLMMGDECHKLKNPNSGCARHFRDWRRENWHTPLMLVSGTITDRSLLDFGHLLEWTHGKVRMPLPAVRTELSMWARAVDEKVEVRSLPGALSLFLADNSKRELKDYRKAVGDRVFATSGVVRTKARKCNATLTIKVHRPRLPADVRERMKRVESDKKGWHGEELTPAEVWRNKRGLALGFHEQWVEPGPEMWMKRRSSWKKYARDILEQDWPKITTEKHVAAACKNGKLPNGRYLKWKEIEPTFKPKTKTVWHTLEVLQYIIKLARQDDVWIWVDRRAVGRKLKELTGWPYYANHGMDGKRFIQDHRKGPAICSVNSNFEGRNLQHYHLNIITAPPTKGIIWEQLMGRTARQGQLADEILYHLLCQYQADDFNQAMSDADYQAEFGGDARKLHLADIIE